MIEHASVDRRTFIQGVAASAAVMAAPGVLAAGRRAEALRVGVIGCGGRGTGAAFNALEAAEATKGAVRIVALGDLFPERVEGARKGLAEKGEMGTVSEKNCFTGFDAYKGVIATDCDVVILATPPGFRPSHFKAAVDAGKHVFMEKPVAVDAPGVRMVLAAAADAERRKLSVVAGTQRRHEQCYLEAMERIHRGDLGKVVGARCFWNQQGLWDVEPRADRSDMENQVRNWLYHAWLSGDHVVEQHVHNIDVVNWAFQAVPERCVATGGRQSRTQTKYGHIYDHFACDFTYPGNRFALSMARQQEGTDGRVQEFIHGSDGMAELSSGSALITGAKAWKFAGKQRNPYVQEHIDLQSSIRGGSYLNEGKRIAESTLCAIMIRMAAYRGKEITWEQAMNDTEDLMPKVLQFGPNPQAPVAIPGEGA